MTSNSYFSSVRQLKSQVFLNYLVVQLKLATWTVVSFLWQFSTEYVLCVCVSVCRYVSFFFNLKWIESKSRREVWIESNHFTPGSLCFVYMFHNRFDYWLYLDLWSMDQLIYGYCFSIFILFAVCCLFSIIMSYCYHRTEKL